MNNTSNYYKQVKNILAFFEGLKVGQGLMLSQVLMPKRSDYSNEEFELISLTIRNLIDQGYLLAKENGFVVLTQDGYDCLQDSSLPCYKVNLSHLVSQFDDLWLIIGKKEAALFYVSGPNFYKSIKTYLSNLPNDYNDYIEYLKKKGLPTSRIKWFRDLFKKLNEQDSKLFLNDLSKVIEQSCSNCKGEDSKDFVQELEMGKSNVLDASTLGNENNRKSKKKVFISYCWENEEHQQWVQNLANDLNSQFEIQIDLDQPLGSDLNKFMEQIESKADKVLVIVTPEYKRRADERIRGVGYETKIISNNLISDQNQNKIIPIIRKGNKETSYPICLGNLKGLDMTDEGKYNKALQELIRNLDQY